MWLLSIVLLFCNLLALLSTLMRFDNPQNILSESCKINKSDEGEESEDMCEGNDEEEHRGDEVSDDHDGNNISDDHDKEPCFHEDFTPSSKSKKE